MKSFSSLYKILFVIALCAAGFIWVSAQGTQTPLPNQDFDLYGYACNPAASQVIGCVSLNRLSSVGQPGFSTQPSSAFVVRYNPATGVLTGSGWSPVLGEIQFGQQCPSYITVPGAQLGLKCAKVVNLANNISAGNGWQGYIYTGSVTYRIPSTGTPTGLMTGSAWEGVNTENLTAPYSPDVGTGILDFNQYAYIEIPGCMDPNSTTYNPYATVNTGCTPPFEICTNEIDDNNNGTINEGCSEICNDGIDNDQDNPRQVDENPPCTGTPPPGWCNDGLDNNGDGLIDRNDPVECPNLPPTGGAIIPKYREI